tara:strand:+ start:439 stop:711 length:273 start_codon:yes stop_codon:yes gene_type:complete
MKQVHRVLCIVFGFTWSAIYHTISFTWSAIVYVCKFNKAERNRILISMRNDILPEMSESYKRREAFEQSMKELIKSDLTALQAKKIKVMK